MSDRSRLTVNTNRRTRITKPRYSYSDTRMIFQLNILNPTPPPMNNTDRDESPAPVNEASNIEEWKKLANANKPTPPTESVEDEVILQQAKDNLPEVISMILCDEAQLVHDGRLHLDCGRSVDVGRRIANLLATHPTPESEGVETGKLKDKLDFVASTSAYNTMEVRGIVDALLHQARQELLESQEKWMPVAGYEEIYKISNMGRVVRLDDDYEITPWKNSKGYYYVSLSKDSENKHYRRGKLVALHFVANPYGKDQVNHIDGDKTNDRAYNLEWCSLQENKDHARETGLTANFNYDGKSTKLDWDKVDEIREKYKTGDYYHKDLAKEYGVSTSTITRVLNNQAWVRKSQLQGGSDE